MDHKYSGRYLPDGKLNVAGRWKSPGPGKYLPPPCLGYNKHDLTVPRAPAYTIGAKHKDQIIDENSPGPVYSVDPKVLNTGRDRPPASAIVSRPREYSLWTGPGPNQYAVKEKFVKPSNPSYSIGLKHKHLEIPTHPVGPNQYSLPNTIGNNNFATTAKTAPKYSISFRHKFMDTTFGMTDNTNSKLYAYDIDKIKGSTPKWTMLGRNFLPEVSNQTPGPNRYRSESVNLHKRTPPKFSMGIRHSELCSCSS